MIADDNDFDDDNAFNDGDDDDVDDDGLETCIFLVFAPGQTSVLMYVV